MTSIMPQMKTCPHCGGALPTQPGPLTDKVPAMFAGSIVAVAAIGLRFGGLLSEWGMLVMLGMGLGVAFHHRFTGLLKLWKRNGGKP